MSIFEDKLKQLEEFNPSLVYTFDPEPTVEAQIGIETFETRLLPEAAQRQDMLEAYLYAQTDILPQLKELNGNIDKQQFLSWFNELHRRLSKALMQNNKRPQYAGKYTEEPLMRWHKGPLILDHLANYFSNRHPCKSYNQLALYLVKDFGVEKEEILAFIKLLKKIMNNKAISMHESVIPFVDKTSPCFSGINALQKLHHAYFKEGFLTVEEEKIVDKIVKPCIFPPEIPAAMDAFADQTLTGFAACNPQDLDQVAKFLAEMFYQFTDIHPYANGNGRTATAMINIFLRYFGLPSILLRHPGDKNDEKSNYSQAIARIDETRLPLQQLIKKRIVDAKVAPFSDKPLHEIACLRAELAEVIPRIKQKNPMFTFESIQQRVSPECLFKISRINDLNKQSIMYLNEILRIAQAEAANTDKMKAIPYSLNKFSEVQKEKLLFALEKLTVKSGWKWDNNRQTAWLQTSDEGNAEEILNKLSTLGIGNTTKARRSDNKTIWVVKCESINFLKLTQVVDKINEKPLQLLQCN